MRLGKLWLCVLSFFYLCACSSEKPGEVAADLLEDYGYQTEVIDGIKTITNPAESFKGRFEMDMVDEFLQVKRSRLEEKSTDGDGSI